MPKLIYALQAAREKRRLTIVSLPRTAVAFRSYRLLSDVASDSFHRIQEPRYSELLNNT